ncbi:MAG: EamA family transporter [Candidatus Omnitrophota bacterium]
MKIEILLLLLLTAILWGVTPVLEKIGLGRVDPLTGVTIRSIAVAFSLIIYLLFTGRIKQVLQADFKAIVIFSVTGLIAGLFGMLTYFAALKRGATSQVVPIAATYPLIAVILSILILGERVTPIRIAGTAFIILGIWFVQG